jgi:ribosomal protein S18 acetylase RimI-like enzyme
MIRRAEKRDIPELARLLYQVNNVHAKGRPDLFRMNRRKYNDEELSLILEDQGKAVFVLTEDDQAVKGYAFCLFEIYQGDHNMVDRKTLYIDDICVDEACRRQHVGEDLYRHVLEFARENAFYNVTLNVWSCNPGARLFYEKMGLVPYKTCMEVIL